VGFGVGNAFNQSGTICFQNSPWASSGNCMPGNTLGYSGPNRKIAQAPSWAAPKTCGSASTPARPPFTCTMPDGSAADRPRAAWSIT
jgi:hypothetical protein